MKACFPFLDARTRADFSAYRTHPSPANLTKLRPAWSRSVDQLELGWLYTALPTKARAQARRSFGFLPHLRGSRTANFSICTYAKMLANCRSSRLTAAPNMLP
jgi:hypothetical protein